MRKMYHLSFSSHEEVMFRSEEDINYGFNCFALACLETDSRPLADSEMTTHVHFGLYTDAPEQTFSSFRYMHSRYFNSKYKRRGSLGEKAPFLLAVDGLNHSVTMLSYIFRQALHHGLSDSPFGYRHNSVNVIFQKELGKSASTDLIRSSHMSKFLPRPRRDIPGGYRMDKSGLLLREDVIDTAYVEELFITPRNFLYQMNRPSSDQWKQEQMEDNNGLPPISLSDLEPECFRPSIQQMLQNETARNYRNRISDLELCSLIDNFYLKGMSKETIYELTPAERKSLGNRIYSDMRNGKISALLGRNPGLPDIAQIRRCALCFD